MSEEEKAIEEMKKWLNYNKKHKNILLRADEIIKIQETILNLISNLQKENEELKNMSGIDVYKLGQKTQRDKTNFEIERLQKELDKKDKVINYIAKHTYIRTGENGVLDTITEEVIEHLYKKAEEEK